MHPPGAMGVPMTAAVARAGFGTSAYDIDRLAHGP
jgi:3-hydroxyisobutyrate dehydrogenase-like beta-hydroxyacid dehydrogenase